MSNTKSAYEMNAVVDKTSADEIFFAIEADCPEDISDLMFGGRRIESHAASNWLYDDGR